MLARTGITMSHFFFFSKIKKKKKDKTKEQSSSKFWVNNGNDLLQGEGYGRHKE